MRASNPALSASRSDILAFNDAWYMPSSMAFRMPVILASTFFSEASVLALLRGADSDPMESLTVGPGQ